MGVGGVATARIATQAPDLTAALSAAEGRARNKDELELGLTAVAARYASLGRAASLEGDSAAARSLALHHEIVITALTELEKNAQPALLVESLVARLRAL